MNETVLVTGGAGYVGSHACKALAGSGYVPVVYDNLSTGHADLVQWGALEVGDILDPKRLDAVFDQHKPVAVLHFAALSIVSESVAKPDLYHRNNVAGSRCLLQAMARHNIAYIVFSSTAAVYGTPDQVPITEDMPKQPINPYGETKAAIEDDLARSGLSWTALRYFNASGADADSQTGEHHTPETHLIPLVLDVALGRREVISIFGDDYETPDGTCLRDYIHVTDLADAHVRALARLLGGGESGPFNLGAGIGTSVNEIIEAVRAVTGHAIPTVTAKRRAGDPPVLVCSNVAASQALDWWPSRGIEIQISDAWRWHKVRFG